MKIEYEFRDDIIDNINERFTDVFVIETNEKLIIDSRIIGIIRMKTNVKDNRKYLKVKQHVSLPESRVLWKSRKQNNNYIIVVKSHWVKSYTHDCKIPVVVPVLASKKKLQDENDRIYFKDFEELELTYNQYVSRMMVIDYHSVEYGLMAAYENYKKRISKYKNYYQAINETSKQYLIEHKILKEFISKVGHSKKKYKKDWLEFKMQDYENKIIDQELDEVEICNKKEEGKVVYLGDVRF